MLSIKNLNFSYDNEKKILKDINVVFDKKINIILGPNGCGKSTLLKCIFGLLDYDGEIKWAGNKLKYGKINNKTIAAYLPQRDMESKNLTVLETVILSNASNMSWRIKNTHIKEAIKSLEMLNISELYDKKLYMLSGGEKKLVMISQILLRNPKVILMDEPTNNLDIQKQLELFEIIQQLSIKKKIMFIIVSHDINHALRYGDSVLVLDKNNGSYTFGKPTEVINTNMMQNIYGVKSVITKGDISTILPVSSVNDIEIGEN